MSASAVKPSIAVDEHKGDEVIDPLLERMVPEVCQLPQFPLDTKLLFNENGTINLKNLRDHLTKEGRLNKQDAIKLIRAAGALFEKEPNLVRLRQPIAVCGDIHGQFFDLLRLMRTAGNPSTIKYLFLGDYVDRGQFSTEVVFYLFAHKITYHGTFFMLRGNHECRHLTAFFTFREECMYKYDLEVYDEFMNAFDHMPLAATINHRFFCVHGGLSPDISRLQEIAKIDRHRETPREGPFCDLLWADPYDENSEANSGADEEQETGKRYQSPTKWFSYNETRQCSYVYGTEATKQFLERNHLQAILRGHEVQNDGYRFSMTKGTIPKVVTIFSAPNYCDVYKNKGACLQLRKDQLKIRQFCSSPHPYYLPNFMDVFTWSLPFISEKVIDMVYHVLEFGNEEREEEYAVPPTPKAPIELDSKEEPVESTAVDSLMVKLEALAKFRSVVQTIQTKREKIIKLKSLSPNKKLESGLLSKGPAAIDEALDKFDNVRDHDLAMEAMPTEEGKPGVPGAYHRTLSGRSFTFKDMSSFQDMKHDSDIEEELAVHSNKDEVGKNERPRRFAVTVENYDEEYFV